MEAWMGVSDKENLLAVAIEAARLGGNTARDYFGTSIAVTKKGDNSPVTIADQNAEKVMVNMLRHKFPTIGFCGEEGGKGGSTERRWLIDPVDGTMHFIRNIPSWATMVALEENGVVTVGVVYNPITEEMWYATLGSGAWKNGVRIRVSRVDKLEDSLLLVNDLRWLLEGGSWEQFTKLIRKTYRQRGPCDFYGYMLVAEGKGDIYCSGKVGGPWDIAAPSIILHEAGGIHSDFQGDTSIDAKTSLSTNGVLHAEVLKVLSSKI